MWASNATSHHDLIKQWALQYDADLRARNIQPFVYPAATYAAAVVLLYLLIDHRNSRVLRHARFLVWAFNAYWSIWAILHCKSRTIASGFGIGLTCSWSVLWTAILLLFKDAQRDFMRIERTEGAMSRSTPDDDVAGELETAVSNGHVSEPEGAVSKSVAHSDVAAGFEAAGSNGHLSEPDATARTSHLRKRVGGSSNGSVIRECQDGTLSRGASPDRGAKAWPAQRKGSFAWQVYPRSPFIERLDWVSNIFSSFGGMGWNWRISGLPPPPKWVQEQLQENSEYEQSDNDTRVTANGRHRYDTTAELFKAKIPAFVLYYLMLDAAKTIMMRDKYFWGLVESSPSSYLPSVILGSPMMTKTYRLVVTHIAIVYALKAFFLLGPIFFAGILGTELIGARGEPWMYPEAFGSFSMVFNKGLAGWWGGWWHQSFRYAFETPAKTLITKMRIDNRSFLGKLLQLVIAFSISGALHASGTLTLPGPTYPLRPFLFFFLQSFGIIGQSLLCKALQRLGISDRVPKLIRQISNFAYTYVWFYYTSPLMLDEFARGGMWLYEPVPLSPLRGLGFGDRGDGWWCWGGQWAHWHTGKHWWESGFAV